MADASAETTAALAKAVTSNSTPLGESSETETVQNELTAATAQPIAMDSAADEQRSALPYEPEASAAVTDVPMADIPIQTT